MPSILNSSSTGASLVSVAGVKCAGGSTPNPSAARASLLSNDPQPSSPDDFRGFACRRRSRLSLPLGLPHAVPFLSSAKILPKVEVRAACVHSKSSPAISEQHKALL
jgi:hypothetical protein